MSSTMNPSDMVPRNDDIPHPVTMKDARPWYYDLSCYDGDKNIGKTTTKQLERRDMVAKLWFEQRLSDAKIADILSVSPSLIRKDKQWLLAQWKRIILGDVTELLSYQLSQLERMIAELWKAWHMSYKDVVTVTTKTVTVGNERTVTEQTVRTGRLPDPRYMTLLIQVNEIMTRLLGLEDEKNRRNVESFFKLLSETYENISKPRKEAFEASAVSVDEELEGWK